MKKYVRLLTFLLVLCMVIPALVACDSEEATTEEATTAGGSDAATEFLPEVEKKNYDEEFYMYIQPDVNPFDYYWVEESKHDIMSDAVYERQEKVNKYLGVEVFASKADDHTSYTEAFKNSISNKDGSIHFMLSHVHSGIEGIISGNYLLDFQDLPGIDLDAEYWDYDYMDGLAISDHMYLGYSDFNILYTYVITFNKTMMDQYGDNLDESVYDMVINYRWTLDKMISIANLVYLDSDGNTIQSEGDTFGITGNLWVPFIGFMQAANIQLVEENEKGMPVISCYNDVNREKTVQLVDKLHELACSDTAWFWYRVEPTPTVSLSSGRALMSLYSTNSLPDLAQKEIDFGILPYPMWDENQASVGYRSLQWGGYQCIPSYLENPVMVGETLEMLSYFSSEVNEVYYNKLLGKQAAEAPLDKQMLDIVWESVCSDLGQTFTDLTGILYLIPELTHENTTANIASYISGRESSGNKAMSRFIKVVEKNAERN